MPLSAGVEELARRFGLDRQAADRLDAYASILIEDPRAPTKIRRPEAVLRDHLADSLVALELEVVRTARSIADLGSGAGLPGLPLAIARPGASVTLVESNARKADFLRAAAATCGISNSSVAAVRAEVWPEGTGRHDLVTARAVDHLSVVAEYAAPLLQLGGWLVAWRGRRQPAVEREAAAAAAELGLEVGDVRAVAPYHGAENRHLHLLQKVAATPNRYPRRAGMARKRPLGVTSRQAERGAARSDRQQR